MIAFGVILRKEKDIWYIGFYMWKVMYLNFKSCFVLSQVCSVYPRVECLHSVLCQSRPPLLFLHQMTQMCTTTLLMDTISFYTLIVKTNAA